MKAEMHEADFIDWLIGDIDGEKSSTNTLLFYWCISYFLCARFTFSLHPVSFKNLHHSFCASTRLKSPTMTSTPRCSRLISFHFCFISVHWKRKNKLPFFFCCSFNYLLFFFLNAQQKQKLLFFYFGLKNGKTKKNKKNELTTFSLFFFFFLQVKLLSLDIYFVHLCPLEFSVMFSNDKHNCGCKKKSIVSMTCFNRWSSEKAEKLCDRLQ